MGRRRRNLHVYSMGLGTQLVGSGILNFGAVRSHPELSPVGRDETTHSDRGTYLLVKR